MDRLRPPRPALTFGEKGLALTHTPPTYASHVALYLYDADGRKRFLDADRNELLAPGETGGALSVQGGHRQDVYLDDVGGAGEFSATVCYRSLNGFAFSPESPRSNTVVVALPAAPCAPLLEPITRSTVKITVAAPAFCPRISVKVEDQSGATYRVVPHRPIKYGPGGYLVCSMPLVAAGQFDVAAGAMTISRLTGQGAFVVTLPLRVVEYTVSVAASNGAGWSPFGPAAKIRIADHGPLAPAAPTLTLITEDSVDVNFTRPPTATLAAAPATTAPRVMVSLRAAGGTDDLFYDEKMDRLIGKVDAGFNVGNCYVRGLHCAIGGLDPSTDYEVKVWALNTFGASPSPGTSFKTSPSEVEVTGVKTAEERDAELKRQAVDVDADSDDAPETKRPRQDVHTGLLGIDTVDLTCPISTGLLVNPLKARPCGHVYSKASAMAYFKGAGKRCAVFGCDKHLKWSDFVVDEASERALREYYRRQARTRQGADGHPYGQLM